MADVRAGGADQVVGAVQVHRDVRVPDRGVPADERHLRPDPRVGDRDVKAAQPLHGLGDRAVHLIAVGDVALEPRRAAALGGDLLEQLGLEPQQRHARAALVQAPRGQRADAARGTGDEDSGSTQRALSVIASIS